MRHFSNKLEKIVIKIGSSSITHKNGAVNIERIEELAKEISNIQDKNKCCVSFPVVVQLLVERNNLEWGNDQEIP